MNPKSIIWLGSALDDLQAWPALPKQLMGYQLHLLQRGDDPTDWKPINTIGPGVREVRVRADGGAWRVMYLAQRPEGVYVLHAFQKKTQSTAKADIELAKRRLKLIKQG